MPLIHQRDTSGWVDWFAGMDVARVKPLQGPIFEDANAVMRGAIESQGVTLGWMPLTVQEIETGRVIQLFNQPVAWKKQYYVNIAPRGLRNNAAQSVVDWLRKEGRQD